MPTRGLLREHSSLGPRTDGKTQGRFSALWLYQANNTEMGMHTRGLLREHTSLGPRTDGKKQGRFSALWLYQANNTEMGMHTRGLLREHTSLGPRTDGKKQGRFSALWLIFRAQQLIDGNAYQGAPKGTYFSRTKSGWQDVRSFFSYVAILANVFHPFIMQKKVPLPVLLFVDGLSCHQSLEVALFCRERQIILYRFSAQATHIMQPLDLTVFRSLKSKWHHAE